MRRGYRGGDIRLPGVEITPPVACSIGYRRAIPPDPIPDRRGKLKTITGYSRNRLELYFYFRQRIYYFFFTMKCGMDLFLVTFIVNANCCAAIYWL